MSITTNTTGQAGTVTASVTNPLTSPQPTPSQSQIIQTLFSVVNIGLMALYAVPGIPPAVISVIDTAVKDLEAAYNAYITTPNATTLAAVQSVVDQAFADATAILHP